MKINLLKGHVLYRVYPLTTGSNELRRFVFLTFFLFLPQITTSKPLIFTFMHPLRFKIVSLCTEGLILSIIP